MKKNRYRLSVPDSVGPLRKLTLQLKEIMQFSGQDFHVRRRYTRHTHYTAILDDETLTYIYLRFPILKRDLIKISDLES